MRTIAAPGTNRLLWYALVGTLVTSLFGTMPTSSAAAAQPRQEALARQIANDATLTQVYRMATELLKSGLNAGSGYSEVWIRDLNTFIEVALKVNPRDRFREALLTFLKFQGPKGDIVDGYVPLDQAKVKYAYRTSALATNLMAHKNTVETDQESSLVQAVRKYVQATRDQAFLDEQVDGATVRERLGRALHYVLSERFDTGHGLAWGATTADWGDVQPESPWGVELDADSHRSLDIYDNAMLLIALNDYLQLLGDQAPEAGRWKMSRDALRRNVRQHLWDGDRQQFIPHVYLGGSPFPKDFDEREIYYHGGTAVAIEAGLLTREEALHSLSRMVANVRAAGAGSIGLTLYPPYPEGYFKNPQMRSPYSYQNGGDWCWFGGRMIQELVKLGYVAQAYEQLRPMVERVKRTGGFHEWWSRDNQPRGSGQFRGSAGVLGRAIEMLQAWAQQELAGAGAPRPLKVFIFAGQSNMEGADAHPERIDDFPMFKGAGTPQADVLYAYLPRSEQDTAKGWGPLRPLDAFGSELTFARRLKAHDDDAIAIIKSAVGGTTIAYDWNPDAPEKGQKLYPRTLKLIQASLQELDKRGVRYQLEGVMWHQGENDMLDRQLNTNYAVGLKGLIARLRQDLNAPNLKWFVAEVSEKGIWGMDNRHNLAILREQQDQVMKSDPILHWVPTSHLAFEVMDSGQPHYHFGTQGQLQMGEAFANAYLDSIGKAPKAKERTFTKGMPLTPKSRVRLFVLAGQRNMEGEDSFVTQIPQAPGFGPLARDQDDVLFRYSVGGGACVSRTWEPLGPVGGLGTFGPELSFGARLRREIDPRDGVAIVKFTHSGAQGPDWSPRGSKEARRNLYPAFIAFIRDSIEDLARKGFDCTPEGIFWHTGENDTYFGPYQKQYAAWMKELIAQVRLDLARPDLAWFISEQHPRAIWRNMDAVNASLNAMAQSEQRLVMIRTAHLPHERVHFGTEGTLLLGDEMARAYLKAR